jgi:tetratricopeptide (TPR) repeat protein
VIPAREMLGDMLLQINKPGEALQAYESDLQKHPKRFNAVYGAALAAEKTGNVQRAKMYFQQLVEIAGHSQSTRPELKVANRFLNESIVQ